MSQAKQQKLGKRETRDLDVEIGFLEGLVVKDPQYVEALQLLADDYTRRGRINDGLRVDHQLKSLRAINELLRAIEAGYRDFDWMLKDPDLAEARKDPAFQKVQDQLKTLKDGI